MDRNVCYNQCRAAVVKRFFIVNRHCGREYIVKDWNETLFGSKRSKKRISVICIAIIAGILLALLGMIAIDGSGRSTASQMVPTGLMKWENVLPADDARTEQAIQDDIMEKAVRIAYLEGQKAMLDSLDDAALWERFDGAALIGDSRVEGFKLYTSVPQSHIFSKNGATILHMDSVMDAVAIMDPQRVFIAYGINDIKAVLGGDASGYAEVASEKIRTLSERIPEAEIYVNSILPASPSRTAADKDYQKVPLYNEALREMCEENGWIFIDNTEMAQENSALYVNDGIHLTAGFYRYWGQNMLFAEIEEHAE